MPDRQVVGDGWVRCSVQRSGIDDAGAGVPTAREYGLDNVAAGDAEYFGTGRLDRTGGTQSLDTSTVIEAPDTRRKARRMVGAKLRRQMPLRPRSHGR